MEFETEWDFSTAHFDRDDDLIAVGADLKPGTVIAAYVAGAFPMGLGDGGAPPMGWWSPQRRGVLRRGDFHASHSLRKSIRRFDITVDAAFTDVMLGCADPGRDGGWITADIRRVYERLHELGLAHSIEVWDGSALAGGLYGLALGGLFAGESKFHRVTDASKVALWALSDIVYAQEGPRLIDVQWATSHLRTLGVSEMPREEYRARLPELVRAPAIEGLRPVR